MARFLLLLLFALTSFFAFERRARGQTFELTSASLEDGATGVPLAPREVPPPATQDSAFQVRLDSISIFFKFNKQLPFNTNFVSKFHWEPRYRTFNWYTRLGEPLPGGGATRLDEPRFTVEHQAGTDYVVFVYGVRSKGDVPMSRPFVLNYTTAAEHGTQQVCGTVAFSEDTPSVTSPVGHHLRAFTSTLLDRPFYAVEGGTTVDLIRPGTGERLQTVLNGKDAYSHPPLTPKRASKNEQQDVSRSIVFLLDAFDLDVGFLPARAAAAASDDGTYCMKHVRPGTYYPVAINFADEEGDAIGAYGYHDANGDRLPDPITVSDDVADVSVFLYTPAPFTARARAAAAYEAARSLASEDARLIEVSNRPHPFLLSGSTIPDDGPAPLDGEAYVWQYAFYSPSQDRLYLVAMDPINASALTFNATSFNATQVALPETFLDSDGALAIAEDEGGRAFRASYPDTARISVALEAGDLGLSFRPPERQPFWKVTYALEASEQFAADTHTVFLDISSGALLSPQLVDADRDRALPASVTLGANYPNPFTAATTIPFTLPREGAVRLSLYNMLGQRVATLIDGVMGPGEHNVRWAPTNLANGLYLCRLEASGTVLSRRVLLARWPPPAHKS